MSTPLSVWGCLLQHRVFHVCLYDGIHWQHCGVPKALDSDPEGHLGLALSDNIGLLALFGIQHSVMARPGFKRVRTKIVPKPIERSRQNDLIIVVLPKIVLLYFTMHQADKKVKFRCSVNYVTIAFSGHLRNRRLCPVVGSICCSGFILDLKQPHKAQ